MLDVEQAIREVGSIYQTVTGRPIEAGRSELPPGIDAREYVESRYRQLQALLTTPTSQQPFTPASGLTWSPALEVVELEQEVRFALDLPGVARDLVSVAVVGNWLVVRGQRGGAPAPGTAVRYSERIGGAFQRVIPLPARARRDGIRAALTGGVLDIGVPTNTNPNNPGTSADEDRPGVSVQPIEIK